MVAFATMPKFTTVKRLHALFTIAMGAPDLQEAGGSRLQEKAWWEIAGILIVTLALLVGSMVILLTAGYDEATKKWATGAIGLVAGYYLR